MTVFVDSSLVSISATTYYAATSTRSGGGRRSQIDLDRNRRPVRKRPERRGPRSPSDHGLEINDLGSLCPAVAHVWRPWLGWPACPVMAGVA